MKDNKQIGRDEVSKIIDELYSEYRLPIVNISDNEWDVFLEVIGNLFNKNELKNDYIVALNIIIRRALNYSLIDNANEFTIDYLIEGLNDLTVFNIFTDKIMKIKDEIRKRIIKQKKYIKQ